MEVKLEGKVLHEIYIGKVALLISFILLEYISFSLVAQTA